MTPGSKTSMGEKDGGGHREQRRQGRRLDLVMPSCWGLFRFASSSLSLPLYISVLSLSSLPSLSWTKAPAAGIRGSCHHPEVNLLSPIASCQDRRARHRGRGSGREEEKERRLWQGRLRHAHLCELLIPPHFYSCVLPPRILGYGVLLCCDYFFF